jgi:GH25 family lysozyme M1 (1,4-beta-N-acetylmuramidase)
MELIGADRRLTLPPILDLSWSRKGKGVSPADLIDWTLTWLDRAEELTGQVPIFATTYSYWKWKLGCTTAFRRYHLWISQNSKAKEMGVDVPKHPIPGHVWAFWRFSSTASVAGVSARRCGVSAFSGRRGELSALSLSRAGFGGVFPLREYSFDSPSLSSGLFCWAREILA